MLWLYRSWRRKRLAKRPLPEAWRAWIDAAFPFAKALSAADRAHFLDHLKVFAWEKYWFGAGGLVLDEEMKVIISGCAARIAFALPMAVYDRLTEIVVYPHGYRHPARDGEEDDSMLLGEAHRFGTVVLAWDAVRKGITIPHDGHDTAIHEFAHVLDVGDGAFDGTPELHHRADYRVWTSVLSESFYRLRENPEHSMLRSYGAENEAEFFAVATEAFFEKPKQLAAKEPALYAALKTYFRQDPAARADPNVAIPEVD